MLTPYSSSTTSTTPGGTPIKLSPSHAAAVAVDHHSQIYGSQNAYLSPASSNGGNPPYSTRDFLLRRDNSPPMSSSAYDTSVFNPSDPIFTDWQMNSAASGGGYYGMHPHHPTQAPPFFRYMRHPSSAPTIKQEMTCLWIEQDCLLKKPCNKVFGSLHEIVTHITVEHVGGPEISNHACYWENCAREGRPFKAKYKLVNHIRYLLAPRISKSTKEFIQVKSHFDVILKVVIDDLRTPLIGRKHSHVHTSDKPYNCKVRGCDKSYTHPSSLRKHLKVHGKDAVFVSEYDSDDSASQSQADTTSSSLDVGVSSSHVQPSHILGGTGGNNNDMSLPENPPNPLCSSLVLADFPLSITSITPPPLLTKATPEFHAPAHHHYSTVPSPNLDFKPAHISDWYSHHHSVAAVFTSSSPPYDGLLWKGGLWGI
ncbi:Pair-rule protein odd-paired,Zinc finger protein ZIC 1,Zinc finger protein ZIC 4,Zinc finger protein ZIC 2,Zinc finger protein ZIC 2-A,Zinc finger protein ZIC 2-B,Zinc finger protein ZIC 5,Zinc finger protein ZIC 3 [Lepeophtheirus salmonis]|uniref:Uncharacterized protein n=1 Tax=Lepeophtheirus salmonis TaxID=72036 RepID=A0A7R8H7G6_LEPSM|nr:Pair-rule protein odd-paired,Zinc finger protein ZIC 1,Zinc finger protein ZIC 4,Zinc finger protein ZIC 2,Zinc finger protein ZIC 2-A,Zinc finger protein ZIC 2-B,Zinc finger protein ZIC 5,Zinc finger protein ZIC 3 [Lepeophtheirus salmonis]CAF2918095.1 Pair-rule protein odd-paired,Zinc finger protein ZIC 1,Zinc finger protein ZIC 4,Zinc finger protein ZIC 2,Zinc finger protein ZIC 2-A,Zinc finger protein ZIC 2-B,Zinc finger protein ZIC 5,Zinc finger protein ZIC 3 [Lepeophtheirus salmonis]